MSSKTAVTTPTPSPDPKAPDYAVPAPQEAWERFERLVGKVIEVPKQPLLEKPEGLTGEVGRGKAKNGGRTRAE